MFEILHYGLWSGAYSNIIVIDDHINLNVDHDLEILQNLKDKNSRGTKHMIYIYTDEEETSTTIKIFA
jgi:hypothetical protein